jgi:hypothetical protein
VCAESLVHVITEILWKVVPARNRVEGVICQRICEASHTCQCVGIHCLLTEDCRQSRVTRPIPVRHAGPPWLLRYPNLRLDSHERPSCLSAFVLTKTSNSNKDSTHHWSYTEIMCQSGHPLELFAELEGRDLKLDGVIAAS